MLGNLGKIGVDDPAFLPKFSEYTPTQQQLDKLKEIKFNATGITGDHVWGFVLSRTTPGVWYICSFDTRDDYYWCNCKDRAKRKRPCIHLLRLKEKYQAGEIVNE